MDSMMRYGNVDSEVDSGDKVSKRRIQNSAAAKRHREKRKRELGDLRDENDWLRTQQAQSRVLIEKMKGKLEAIGVVIPEFPPSEALPLMAPHKHTGDGDGNEHDDDDHQAHGIHDDQQQQHQGQQSGPGAASSGTGAGASGVVSNEQLGDVLADLEARLLDRSSVSLHNIVSSFSGELTGLHRAVKALREAIDDGSSSSSNRGEGTATGAGGGAPRPGVGVGGVGVGVASGVVGAAAAAAAGEEAVEESGDTAPPPLSSGVVGGRSASVAGLADDVDASKSRHPRAKRHRL
jgi:hypothetical protein